VNDKVLASWSDCRFYPAKVLAANKDGKLLCKYCMKQMLCEQILFQIEIVCFECDSNVQNDPAASYTVKFYDGVIQTVKGIHVKPFTKEVHFVFLSYSCCLHFSTNLGLLFFSSFSHSLQLV